MKFFHKGKLITLSNLVIRFFDLRISEDYLKRELWLESMVENP